MREGANLCSECHAPIPPSRGKCARTCSPACRSRRDLRFKRERNTGNASGQGTPSPSPRGSPPTDLPDDYQSHAAERSDLMTLAICYARQAIQDGYEVTILRDGDCAVLRIRPAPEARDVIARVEGFKRGLDGQSLDDFVASRMGGAR